MRTNGSPHPDEPDIHLTVSLCGTRFAYAACLTAAMAFLQDHQQRHHSDAVEVRDETTEGLHRLPNERLFLGP
ncbi:hypothetical protein [Nocardia callitridis]|uniref:STAS domain-containing protein n=1 Tax=Nocardia callitridis TaxID=648753 RepID=A0ABP9JW90_9NOCA